MGSRYYGVIDPSDSARRLSEYNMEVTSNTIRRAVISDRGELSQLRAALWPESSAEEHSRELDALLSSGVCGILPLAIFVSCEESGRLNGFVEVGLRSHADGCDESRPVGYIEGWFVAEGWRRQGIGGELVRAAEEWSRAQGCREMASDALIDNTVSQHVHEKLGFIAGDRCVHFRKPL
jgi:aminoglycoside 6'-N-acetyltransferase I